MELRSTLFAALIVSLAACSEAADRPAPPAPPPPPPAAAAAPDPTPVASAAPEASAMRDQLLGLNKPQPAAQPVADADKSKPRPRRVFVADPAEDAPVEEVPSGPLSDGAFQSAIHAWRGLKACLTAQTTPPTDPSGAIKVAFTVAQSGEVVKSQVVECSNDTARTIAPCVEREARRIRFPAFAADEPITKEAKFVF
jgi:hypothetical protein